MLPVKYNSSKRILLQSIFPRRVLLLMLITLCCIVQSYAQRPTISSIAPLSGAVGSTITIIGTNFSSTAANNIVYFGATRGTVTSATATELQVTVPNGSTYQPISVTTNKLTTYSN